MKQIIKVLACILVHFCIVAQNNITSIGSFSCYPFELEGQKKIFVNNTKYDLQVHYKVIHEKSGDFFAQAPILKRGEKIVVDFDHALLKLPHEGMYHCNLGLSRIKKMATGASNPLVTKKLKAESMAFAIRKNKFLNYKTFAFSTNKNGLLVCKVN